MVSSCGHDENNKYKGGKAGDQTGTEYYVRAWYAPTYGWDCVLRHPNTRVGAKLAEIAQQAANNNKIGYDQNERLTYYNQLKAMGWHPDRITTACESDCSASTAAAVIAAGHQLGLTKLQQVSPSLTTYGMKVALINAGFECLTESKYRTSDKYLLAGDIILNEQHHVIINLTKGSGAGSQTTSTAVEDMKTVTQYAAIVDVSANSFLNVRKGPGERFAVATTGNDAVPIRLPKGAVISIDAESNGWGRWTGTGYWASLAYLKR